MSPLHIATLGPFIASLDDQPIYTFKTIKVQALLIYLAVEKNHPHSRESLMELLWPEMQLESAQVNLRQTIYRLRQSIPIVNEKGGDKQVPLLKSSRHSLQINPDADVYLDIDEFQTSINLEPERSVDIYRGDFLADFYLLDSSPFENWAGQIRQKLQMDVLKTLTDLSNQYIEIGDFDKAQQFAWRQLEIDKLRESAYRQLMIALANSGQRNAALSQFQLCQSRLMKELNLNPSQETIDLYEKIQDEALEDSKRPSIKKSRPEEGRMAVFLLTDIEGSTRLWDEYHETMLTALFTHNQILEERIAQYGGRILELRGDGVKAVFESGNPLECLVAIQKDFQKTDWGEIGKLRIRMGIHGLPEVRKGYDYFKKDDKYYGPVLNHTARIMDSGWGGQILVSEQVHNLYSLPRDTRWKDHGFHRLKNLEQPVHIYELTHPDLDTIDYPPLRTLTDQKKTDERKTPSLVSNLPPQQTPFIGRKTEISNLEQFILSSDSRLITIVGAGGMGKTRLAIALAEKIIEDFEVNSDRNPFPNGIYFVPLAPLVSIDEIIPTIINSLEIPTDIPQATDRTSSADPELKDKLINFLKEKKILIILDNFEHLLDGSDQVAEILDSCLDITIIVTSRERLRLHQEQVFPILGLDYPDLDTTDSSSDFTAMELFIQSARRNKPDFEITEEDVIQLTRICNLIGGMPLGLELAASWVDMLSMEEIVNELRKSLDFLATDIRNIPDRHRSIRAVFDSSWHYLSDDEREIFPKLSVFRGGFSRIAAQKVANATIRNLASFVNKSLLQYNETEGCYQVHELLRQYGEERLKENPDKETDTRQKHSQYFCSDIKTRMDESLKTGDLLAFHFIRDNHVNILEAWNWSIIRKDITNIDNVVDGLCLYYDWNWRDKDGLSLCQSAIELLSSMRQSKQTIAANSRERMNFDRILTKLLAYKAFFTFYSNVEEALSLVQESYELIQKLLKRAFNVAYENALCLYLLGVAYFYKGNFETSGKNFKNSLEISKEINLEFMILRNLNALGDIYRVLGKPREAKEWYHQSLTRARMKKNRWWEMIAQNNLGWTARKMMDYETAKQIYRENIRLAYQYDNPYEIIRAIQSNGFLSIFLGDFEHAKEQFQEVVRISTEYGIQRQSIASITHIGLSSWLRANFEEAETFLDSALSLAKKVNPLSLIFPGICKAEFLIMTGRYQQGNNQLAIAKELSNHLYTDPFLSGRLTRTLGWLALTEGKYKDAHTHFKKSIEAYQLINDDEQIAWSQAGLSRAKLGMGEIENAKEILTDALWTAIELKAIIPLVFILPVSVLILDQSNPQLSQSVYQQIQASPFIANSQFIVDTIDHHLPKSITTQEDTQVSSDLTIKETLWKAASVVMSNWMQVWIYDINMDVNLSTQIPKNEGMKN